MWNERLKKKRREGKKKKKKDGEMRSDRLPGLQLVEEGGKCRRRSL